MVKPKSVKSLKAFRQSLGYGWNLIKVGYPFYGDKDFISQGYERWLGRRGTWDKMKN